MRIKWRVGWKNPIDYNELRERGVEVVEVRG